MWLSSLSPDACQPWKSHCPGCPQTGFSIQHRSASREESGARGGTARIPGSPRDTRATLVSSLPLFPHLKPHCLPSSLDAEVEGWQARSGSWYPQGRRQKTEEGSGADGRASQAGRDFPLMCASGQRFSMLPQLLQLCCSFPCQFSVSVSAEVGL